MSAETLFSLLVGVPMSGIILLYMLLESDRDQRTRTGLSPPEDTVFPEDEDPDHRRAA